MKQQPPSPPFRVIGTRPIRPDGEDKVTGRALYGADVSFPDQLYGAVARSPHPHARILSLDTKKALALPGVEAVVTAADLGALEEKIIALGEGSENLRHMTDRVLAREKVLFNGHPMAAVAARDPWTAEEAAKLIEVRYEPLPHVLHVLEAIKDDAPLIHEDLTTESLGRMEKRHSNIARHTRHRRGDLAAGFAAADIVIEREFSTRTVHQGYIEPHNATALARADGQITVWTSTQGIFAIREQVATVLQVPLSRVRVVPVEIGGGFGGKVPIYLEPLAVLLSRKTGFPVKMTMKRADVFQATGPAGGSHTRVKIGARKDGKITAAQVWYAIDSGAYPTIWGPMGGMCVLASYKLDNLLIDVYDVLTNTTKVSAYRAPATPQCTFGVESLMDEIADGLGMDPLELRLINAVEEGDARADGPVFGRIGLKEVIHAAMASDHYRSPPPAKPNQGRGVALGFWANNTMQSSASVAINMDGTAGVVTGSMDIGGSRASMAIMAAEALGLEAEDVRATVADTDSIGHTDPTVGSRITFATGMAVYEAAQDVIGQLKERVARLWDIAPEEVRFEDGAFRHTGNGHDPLTVKQLASKLTMTGGPVMGQATVLPGRAGPGFGAHIADVEVDPETGKVTILRYTALQDVGRAIHPAYVEGQIEGGVAQGIGWALNEEYVMDDNGKVLNAGFLDYRMPTMYDLPSIETVIVEVPNPEHPYGVRGVGETPIVPPLGTIHNAIQKAVGVRMRDLPMSPPKVQRAIQEKAAVGEPVATRPQ
ncbi:MAG: xanthine dehydrogenase family protein molybdopterin-binding subunit [bacterium]